MSREDREDDIRKRIFEVISIGTKTNLPSRIFDVFIVVVILINLSVTLLSTFDFWDEYKPVLSAIELVTILIFTIEYILRLLTADYLYPSKKRGKAVLAFVFSLGGIVDLLTFFPYYLPIFFPAGAVAFRMLRVIRIFRLFKVNAQNDAFSVIAEVIHEKRQQLMFSVVLILIFMIAASLCMYDLEHEAQPEAFQNAFSGIWWSVSTLLTVGYGDIYPVTIAGKIMAIIISFLGVGMVAIPTGIISAGFVEQYSRRKTELSYGNEHELQFVTAQITDGHSYIGKRLGEIDFPPQLLVVLIIRGQENISPKGGVVLHEGDILVIGAKNYRDRDGINLREITLMPNNEWIGLRVKELPVLQDEMVVLIRRKGKSLIPNGETLIREGDALLLYNT